MPTEQKQHFFFVGIGGSGMSALADIMRLRGHRVSGSDRSHDMGQSGEKFFQLEQAGMQLYPQNGAGVVPGIDAVIVSSAVEETIPDIQAARAHNIPVLRRADLLARMFNRAKGIGIGGTSGKTTTTGMTGWVLHALGDHPTLVNGGIMPNFINHPGSLLGNAINGTSDVCVVEVDESDGTIDLYNPSIAVLNNITLDHKSFEVLDVLFGGFVDRTRDQVILNMDDPRVATMSGRHANTVTYGIDRSDCDFNATDLVHEAHGIKFKVNGRSAYLMVPGRHNVSNALGAAAVAVAQGHALDDVLGALAGFKGIRRRLEILGQANGITVIDDFAHNPDKIAASLSTLAAHPGRLIVMFQPHGFGPMKMMRREITDAFAHNLREHDIITMPEIFYAGGSVTRDISAQDLINDIAGQGRDARFFPTRDHCAEAMIAEARPGDRIVVMGARDESLSGFTLNILERLQSRARAVG
jgi:UDP-N-acetylmuramate--alanine ligase